MPRALPALLLLTACHPGGLAPSHGLTATPTGLRLSSAAPRASFTLRNTGEETEQVTVRVSAPFSAEPASLALGAGAEVDVAVTFAPDAGGVFTQTLMATGTAASATVGLSGETPCVSTNACRRSVHDETTGACVESPAPDGTACASACLNDATCLAGTCVGRPVGCDDGNPCTLDLCNDDTGCFHADGTASCPSDACHAPTCSPDAGCGLNPLPDGTLCGGGECAVRACIAGACVERPMPDNTPCGRASTCQGAGACQHGACEQPPATALQPEWRYDVSGNAQVWSPLMVDSAGQLHWLECGPQPGCTHVSFTEDGVQNYRQPLPGVQNPGDPVLISGTLLVAGEYSKLTAVNVGDGSVAWTHDFSVELQDVSPACGTTPGLSLPYLTSLADDGHGALFAQFQSQGCGDYWAGAWTVKIDRQTGTKLWLSPYLGTWLACDLSYGYGSLVSDEAGNAYVFEGFNGTCSVRAAGVQPHAISLSPGGTQRWSEPWATVNWPTALWSDAFFDQAGERVSVADGGVLSSLALPPPTYNVDTVFSSGGGFTASSSGQNDGLSLYRLDAQGALGWSRVFDGGESLIMGSTPTLTNHDSLLLPVAMHSAVQELWEVGADAGISRCPLYGLPPGLVSAYEQSVLMPSGRWIVVHLSPWSAIESYPLNGVAPATSGWICPGGSETNGRRPR